MRGPRRDLGPIPEGSGWVYGLDMTQSYENFRPAAHAGIGSRSDSATGPAPGSAPGTAPGAGTGAGTGPVRVFLLDDHEVVRRGLKDLLEIEGEFVVVGEASTAAEALARVPAVRPQVAVLDVRLPDGDGVTVCRELRSRMPELACLMLTSFSDDEALFDAILAGASGYLLKQ